MPLRVLGESPSAASAASVGASSPAWARSRSTPWTVPLPTTVRPCSSRRASDGPHQRQDPAQVVARLGGGERPIGHGDPAPADQGGREEGRGVGQVRLHRQVAGAGPLRRDGPAAGGGLLGWHACVVQHRQGHLDMRLARDRPQGLKRKPAVEAATGQQQGRDELAGGRGVDRGLAAAHRAGPVHDERQRPSAAVVDGHPERAQGRQQWAHRTLPRRRVAVEGHRPVRQRRQGGQEAHHRAGQAAVDGPATPQRPRCHPPVTGRTLVVDPDAQGAQAVGHQQGVAGPQRPADERRPVGQRGQDERPGGERLRCRDPDLRVHRAARQRRRPRVWGHARQPIPAPGLAISA